MTNGATGRPLRSVCSEWASYMHLVLRGTPPSRRALIFGQGRSGSKLLVDLVCSTGHFVRHGEILGRDGSHVRFPAAFVKGSACRWSGENFICHVKPVHLGRDRVRVGARAVEMDRFIQSMQKHGFSIIHLRRTNKLRQLISRKMADARGSYFKRDDRPEVAKLFIDPRSLEQELGWRMEQDRAEDRALQGIDVVPVEYERDLEDPTAHQRTVDSILDSLSMEHRPVQTSLRKVNQRSLRDIVENYDEVAARVTELGLGHWLN